MAHSDRSILPDLGALDPDEPPEANIVSEAEASTTAAGAIRAGKLAGRGLWGAIWILAFPILLQQTMQAFVGMTDKLLAGQLPAEIRVPALDAVGIGSYVSWFIGIAMAGLGIGGQALISRGMGSGDKVLAHRALGQSMLLSIVWGVVVGLALWFTAPAAAAACQLSDDALRYYLDYIRTLAISMPFAGVMMVGAMCLHGAGETTLPSLIAVGVNVVNIVFSWMLSGVDIRLGPSGAMDAIVNPFDFDWHVRGIAAGTGLAMAFGAITTLIVLRRGVKDLRLEAVDLRIDRVMVRRIVRIGIPNFLEGLSMWAVNLIVLIFIGAIAAGSSESEGLQGAHIIAVQWEAFSFLPGYAIGIAAGALAGQYLGAGNPEMAERAVLACTAVAVTVMGALGIVFMCFGETLTALISEEPVHLEHAPRLLFIAGTVQVFFGIAMVVRQGLRGVGDAHWTFVITTVSSYAVRMPAAWILGVWLGLGLEGIWYGLCGEFLVRAGLFWARFAHGGWKRIEL